MLDDLFLFVDRSEAGEKLAAKLHDEPLIQKAASEELLVLSIPRGGVVVGATVAHQLGCAHNVIAVKKIGYPGHPELAIGAMAEDGTIVVNDYLMKELKGYIEQVIEEISTQIERTIQKFRQGRELELKSKTVIVVDDGIATGETMKAAVIWLRSRSSAQRPKKVIVAAPVCSHHAARQFEQLADKFICLSVSKRFGAVGQFYWDFDQISDEAVKEYLLQNAVAPLPS